MQNRYPLATVDGKAIPLDVIRPSGMAYIAFLPSAFSAGLDLSAYSTKILSLYSDSDCIIYFGTTPPTLVDSTIHQNALFLKEGTFLTVSMPDTELHVKGITESGILYAQIVDTWAGLSLDMQLSRL